MPKAASQLFRPERNRDWFSLGGDQVKVRPVPEHQLLHLLSAAAQHTSGARGRHAKRSGNLMGQEN